MYSAIHCVSVVFSGENIICIIHNNQQCHAPAPAPALGALPRMYSATVVRTWSSAPDDPSVSQSCFRNHVFAITEKACQGLLLVESA